MSKRIVSLVTIIALLVSLFPYWGTGIVAANVIGDPDKDLILWYTFDQAEGTTVTDQSGNGNDGTLEGGAGWDGGYIGNAVDLNGKDGFVHLPTGLLKNVDNVTISTWVKVDQVRNFQRIFDFGIDTSKNMFLTPHSAHTNAEGLMFGITTSGGGQEDRIAKKSAIETNKWTHVALVIDGSAGLLYENGVEVARNDNLQVKPSDLGETVQNYIGKSIYAADPYLDGRIDDFRIYRRALNDSEIKSLTYYSDEAFVTKTKEFLNLGDIHAVTDDLKLPTKMANGVTITWRSSDETIIGTDGTVVRPENGEGNATVTLTATIRKGAASDTKAFMLTVLEKLSDMDIVEKVKENLEIPNADDVRGNITLPTTTDEGVTITWETDRPDVINVSEVVNDNYDNTPPGVVTRQDTDTQVVLTATISYGEVSDTKQIPLIVKAKPEELNFKGYLFTHFTGESETGEQIYFASSKDGLHWTDLNDGSPVLTSNVGEKGVRDPYIFRSAEGDKFYIIATDLRIASGKGWDAAQKNGSRSIIVWESTDLVNWSEPRMVEVAPPEAGNAWAPEAMYDEMTGEYVVFWASRLPNDEGIWEPQKIYYAKTRDFYTFTEPQLYIDRGDNHIIDTTMIKDNNKYYRYSGDGQITIEESDQILGKWTKIGTLESIGLTGRDVEGPLVFKFNDREEWTLMVDQYATGRGYLPLLTTDLSNGNFRRLETDEYFLDLNRKRHGSILNITQDEYDAIMAKWSQVVEKPDEEEQVAPILEYNFDETRTNSTIQDASGNEYSGTMHGNATYVTDQERNSQVLYLDGSSGTFAAFPTGFFDGRSTVSISMDIKAETVSGNFFTFAIGKNDKKYMFLRTRDTEIRNAITRGSYSYEQEAKFNTDSIKSKWVNIKLVITPTSMAIYKDGVLEVKNTDVTVSMSDLGSDLLAFLGKSFYSADPYFKGYFDNVKVYNRALTESEIAEEFNGGHKPGSAADIKTLVEQYEAEGEFANHGAAHSLTVHLTAVGRFEERQAAEKVIKHMHGFKLLLEYQKKEQLISDKAFDTLHNDANVLIEKWQ